MPKRARRRPQDEAPAARPEPPSWISWLQPRGNAAAVELVTGEAVGEEEASILLEQPVGHHHADHRVGDPITTDEQTYDPGGRLGRVHDEHQERQEHLAPWLDDGLRWSLDRFVAHWEEHQAAYEAVAAETDVPARLIAAIHWRECDGDFGAYLHQGDPLGKKAVNHPSDIPIFHEWHEAAVHAIEMKDGIREEIGITEDTRDGAALATYAEAYNGLGYFFKDKPSPYVYSGTTGYDAGKYVADGVYDPTARDRQLGVLPMLSAVGGVDGTDDWEYGERTAEAAWTRVLSGQAVLRVGATGLAVEALQQRLADAGFATGIDGDFGPGTRSAVIDFQRQNGLEPDGIVGPGTAQVFERRSPARS